MEKNRKIKLFFISLFLFILTPSAAGLTSLLYGRTILEILRNVILSAAGAGLLLYLHTYARINKELDYDNEQHLLRFVGVYIICLLLSLALPLIPPAGWPFLPIFLVLSLFSDSMTGMVGGCLCLMMTVMTGNVNTYGDFFIYFLSGTVGIMFFKGLDETYLVSARIFSTLLVLAVCLCTNYVLMVNEVFNYQLFLLPIVNVAISLLLLVIILKYFSAVAVHKYRIRYLEINDPEFPLLVELKEKNKEIYYHAVHTAYFADRIARRLKLDDQAARGAGYYQYIGLLKDNKNTWEEISRIGKEHEFPPKLMLLLQEFTAEELPLKTKESAVLLFADAIVVTISKFFKEKPDMSVDYKLLIEAVFQKKLDKGLLNHCEITMEELTEIKKIFLEEKLYYDFLR